MSEHDLTHFLENLSSDPGVYQMRDVSGTVLYVGKARNLKKRVSSYFSRQSTAPKTRSLVSQIASVDISITRTETEALLLESSLIKSLHPKYNVLMRDDKTYPWLYLNTAHPFPRFEIMRCKKKPPKGISFGPYPGVQAVRETLNIIQKVFKIRNCRDSYFSGRGRPCLQYQIKRCTAPCTQYIGEAEYQKSVKDALRFLQGKSREILKELAAGMDAAVERLDFEEAAVIRDQIRNLRIVQEQQGIIKQHGDADVIAMEARPGFSCVHCVTVRNGEVIRGQSFFPEVPFSEFMGDDPAIIRQAVFEAFAAVYYVDTPERIPALVILDEPFPELPVMENVLKTLRGKAFRMQTSPRGDKKRWLDFACTNLARAVQEKTASKTLLAGRFEALESFLNLTVPVSRMECFDISHTSGEEVVASCVVFNTGGASKKDYRRFNIKGITPGDDYAAIYQAVHRRFKRLISENMDLPDVLIIDGGKGQVAKARQALQELAVEGIALLGIAKGPARKAGQEKIILSSGNDELSLPEDSPALHLLQQIRDEAHRFAVKSHRQKRSKLALDSSLLSVEGIGPRRRQALLKHFGGMRELAAAPLEEIAKVSGISAALAQKIFELLRG